MSKSTCNYCRSSAYGPGCPFSPNKIHFHAGNAKRCCYCGSVAVGPGCPFNPHSKVHVHGVEFNSMVKDSIDKSITLGYLKSTLTQPITEMKAYELGIIDENGKKIKSPSTAEELSAYGPLEEYVINIKHILGKNIDLIHGAMDIRLESVVTTEEYAKLCETSNKIKSQLEEVGKDFNTIITNAYNSGLSRATIEKLIIDSILES